MPVFHCSVSPCLRFITSIFHRVCVSSHLYSTMSAFHYIYIPQCLRFITSIFHSVCVSSHLYSTVPAFHHIYIPPCLRFITSIFHHLCVSSHLYSTMSAFHIIYIPPCLHFITSIVHRVCVSSHIYSTMSVFYHSNLLSKFRKSVSRSYVTCYEISQLQQNTFVCNLQSVYVAMCLFCSVSILLCVYVPMRVRSNVFMNFQCVYVPMNFCVLCMDNKTVSSINSESCPYRGLPNLVYLCMGTKQVFSLTSLVLVLFLPETPRSCVPVKVQ